MKGELLLLSVECLQIPIFRSSHEKLSHLLSSLSVLTSATSLPPFLAWKVEKRLPPQCVRMLQCYIGTIKCAATCEDGTFY